tara:strand:- start:418 stop:651 length:234 start_codon:yes stop_codon:yes gene_type:complete
MTDYTVEKNMFNKARDLGVLIMAWKDSGFHDEDHFIVMAQNTKLEYVTWLFANGGFHHGHYYNDDQRAALTDYLARN